MKIKARPSQLELVTGAMLEVVKSIKSSSNVVKPSAEIKLDNNTVESIIEKVVNKMGGKINSNNESVLGGMTPRGEKKDKDLSEWKLIEP